MEKPSAARDIILSLKERFRPEKADPGYEAVFHLDISGDRGGQYTVSINDGTITVEEGHSSEATCTISASDDTYEDVEWGRTNPQMAFLFGKDKVSDIGAMLDFAGLFHRCEDFYK